MSIRLFTTSSLCVYLIKNVKKPLMNLNKTYKKDLCLSSLIKDSIIYLKELERACKKNVLLNIFNVCLMEGK